MEHDGLHRLRSVRSDVGSNLARHTSTADAASLASIDRPPSEEDKFPPSKIYHPLSFAVLALLMPASVFGTLARLGLEALVTFDGHTIFPLAWVQAGGCLVMGFALALKDPFGQFYGPFYTAITTAGFCGSFTTFSGWQLAVFQAWINEGRFHRDWLRDVIDGLTQTVFTLALSLVCVSFGAHLASLIQPIFPALPPPKRAIRHSLSVLSILIYAATYPAYFRLPASYRHQATAALLFSFPGTLTRYFLSLRLNPLLHLMPLGTFSANMLGTALIGMFTVLQGMHSPPSPRACALLRGLSDGYCGCLTTVSTFAAEVATLDDAKAWLYVVASCVTAQLLLLVILGPSYWAGHVSEQSTCQYT
ncbi:CrcB-like protein-domain-containing protein [Sparassis latifolia]